MQKLDRLVIKYILFIALVVLIVSNYEQAISYMFHFLRILSPVIVGIIMAYILNILMIKFENIWFPNKNNQWVNKTTTRKS